MQWFKEYKELIFSNEISLEKADLADKLKFSNLPDLLFKYRAINEYSIKNLEEDSVWLSDPRNFNDPYDCSFTQNNELNPNNTDLVLEMALMGGLIASDDHKKIDIIKRSTNPLITLMEICYPEKPDFARKAGEAMSFVFNERGLSMISEASEKMKMAFKLCCFSEDPFSILMWSHYANYHRGFCVAYDFREFGERDPRSKMLYPVIYSQNMFNASDFFSDEGIVNNILYMNQAALIKSTEWSYEREGRLVFGNGVPQEEMSILVPKPKFVILGTNITDQHDNLIRSICSDKGIEVKQMEMSPLKYELAYREKKGKSIES